MNSDFGSFAKAERLKGGRGLRQAAREMGVSATYLSRVENNLDPPSAEIIVKMAKLYGVSIEDLSARARKRLAAARGTAMQGSAELRALYRIGSQLPPDDVDEVLRAFLKKRNFSDEEIEKELAQLKAEFPRIASNGRDGLFAAKVDPRCLSKNKVNQMAYDFLARHGISKRSYKPPTPLELLADAETDIRYRIDELQCRKNGEPLLLGRTGWNEEGEREIVINSAIAESGKKNDDHRFNFTLAHELFHALEHLPRIPAADRVGASQFRICAAVLDAPRPKPLSAAERAVNSWMISPSGARRLFTPEDWREWQANTFSSALLMPEWSVREEFERRTSAEEISVPPDENIREWAVEIAGEMIFTQAVYAKSLHEVYGVSRQAMAIRLMELRLVV